MLGKFVAGANKSLLTRSAASYSAWAGLTPAPADPILGLNDAFKKETNSKKVLLGMGAYRDDAGKPFILDCVRQAEQKILDDDMDHEYSSIQGSDSYIQKCINLGWGENTRQVAEGRVAGAQSISGTGSLRLGLTFFNHWYPHKDVDVLTPSPTWPIHNTINTLLGQTPKQYRYYDPRTKGLDFDGMKEDISNAKDNSLVMFHVCAHNPTGVDPTEKQW
jgi:aspartate aminotransferase